MSTKTSEDQEGEFLWLVSLSDLMILLFVFFVVLFSFSYKKMAHVDMEKMASTLKGEKKGSSLDQVQARLLKWTVDKKLLDSIELTQKEDSLIIEIREKLLFASGKADLDEQGKEILQLMKLALGKIPAPYRIGIEGHTDDEPLKGKEQQGNWELSAKRALGVLRAFALDPEMEKRVVLMAYGPNRPLAPNRDQKNQAIIENQLKNRRVTIRIF